jgi:hypothetical protein
MFQVTEVRFADICVQEEEQIRTAKLVLASQMPKVRWEQRFVVTVAAA